MESLKEWAEKCAAEDVSLPELAAGIQARESFTDPETVRDEMRARLEIMREARDKGMKSTVHSLSGLSGGGAYKMRAARRAGRLCADSLEARAGETALAVAEYNASMGRIVAAPTAGACGILPGVMFALEEEHGFSPDEMTDALLTAAVVGDVTARRATISGAEGGCQAECGTAAAMAAAAAVHLMGGTVGQCLDAVSFALMNILGLVCDPVGGLVEVPCVYRNVSGAVGAIAAADLALSGIPAPLPADEMIDAMKNVGDLMPASLRETGEGGCAACPAALKYLSSKA